MTIDRQVLVVDDAEGTLPGVMEELDQLGFRVVWVPTLPAALEFVEASTRLSLIIVSAAAAERGRGEFLTRIKDLRPALPIIWGARPGAGRSNREDSRPPSSLIPEPFRQDALRDAISSLLEEHFYPKVIADAVQRAALEVLGTMGEFALESRAFLVANQTTLSDFSSIVPFAGDVSGHLLLSISAGDIRAVYRRFLPGGHAESIDRLEDLVGEICNRVLGRVNAFLSQSGLSVQPTTPIFIRAAGSSMRSPGRRPSYGFQLSAAHARVSLEYYLADFDRVKLSGTVGNPALGMGEILYL